jgi:hypothetical protein
VDGARGLLASTLKPATGVSTPSSADGYRVHRTHTQPGQATLAVGARLTSPFVATARAPLTRGSRPLRARGRGGSPTERIASSSDRASLSSPRPTREQPRAHLQQLLQASSSWPRARSSPPPPLPPSLRPAASRRQSPRHLSAILSAACAAWSRAKSCRRASASPGRAYSALLAAPCNACSQREVARAPARLCVCLLRRAPATPVRFLRRAPATPAPSSAPSPSFPARGRACACSALRLLAAPSASNACALPAPCASNACSIIRALAIVPSERSRVRLLGSASACCAVRQQRLCASCAVFARATPAPSSAPSPSIVRKYSLRAARS